MSIVSVDNIQPIGSGTSVTVNSAATLVLNNVNSTGVITATSFVGNLTGNPTGTLQTAAQPNITSVGTLSGLTVAGNVNCTSGRFQRGSATIQDGDAIAGGININGLDMDASVIMSVFGNDGDFTRISGSKSRNASVGSHTIVQNNDVLLSLKGFGSDGTNFEEAAQIEMQVDGTPNNNVMPGRIVFKTATTDGVVERLRIASDGKITVAANSDIRFTNGTWTGEVAGKIQQNSNNLYIQGGTGGIRFRNASSGVNQFSMTNGGNFEITNGDLVVASGHGIDFSATANSSGSMSNELLDDYEEGSFTPYIDREHNNPIIGYDAQDGYYTKIGRVVYFYAEVRINSYNGNGSYGNTFLRGLPYQSAARTGGRGVWNSVHYNSYYRDIDTTDGERDIAIVQGSSEKVVFYVMRSESSWTAPPAPDANDQFKIGGFYFT